MQYIALAFDASGPELSALVSQVSTLAQAAGYQPLVGWREMTGDGLDAFMRTRRITALVFLNCPSRKALKFTSDGIILDLENSVWENRPSVLEAFLTEVSDLCAQRPYYLIMGEEWFVYQYVKYYEGSLDALVGMLRFNMGWQTPLFNFEKESPGSDSETPLVFRITPGSE